MTALEAQKRASAKYAKANVKQIGIKFYPAETDPMSGPSLRRMFRVTLRLSSVQTWRRVGVTSRAGSKGATQMLNEQELLELLAEIRGAEEIVGTVLGFSEEDSDYM